MITKKKLKIYNCFKGDADGLHKTGTPDQKETIENDDWLQIQSLLQDILWAKNQHASLDYIHNLKEKLLDVCDSIETIDELVEMANE